MGAVSFRACSEALTRCTGMAPCQEQRTHMGNQDCRVAALGRALGGWVGGRDGGWVGVWCGGGALGQGSHERGAPQRKNCNPCLTIQTRCSTAFIPPEAWPWPFQVFRNAATSSWFSFGSNLSTCELRNHCRSDPVQVQSTV